MQAIYSFLAKWNKTTDSFTKLQGLYAVIAIAMLLIAGLIALINPALGQSAAFYAVLATLTFIANGVLWALLRTFVLPHIEARTAKTSRKK